MRRELILVLALAIAGCGENQDTTSPSAVGAPENLKALSVNSATVGLQWSAPTGQSDSVGGYVVQVGSVRDTLGKNQLSSLADSLTPGEKTFTVYTRRLSGALSDGAVIKWAPAARFDVPIALYEYRTLNTSLLSALDVGSATLDPAAMTVTLDNASRIDLYLYGGNGAVEDTLQLQSTSLLAGSYNATLFSTVSHSSTGLDYYLSAFPAASTFALDHVIVTDNTIYYVRTIGDNGNLTYARIHVHVQAGASFPSRAVEVRVSLQRVPGLLYAFDHEGANMPHSRLLGLLTIPGVTP
jgi:hypothetical protein